ncbi:hypothetical protein V6N13_065412 [Hibiscus sabdariffa]|uniref:Uncharacterized protein n=1 Tax=Hibiscus sabdariffa TaxID=183260 RepID=A0ABR2QQX2_9ROSI
MNVLAASSLLDAYYVPSVAFVTYSDSLAEDLFQLSFSSSKDHPWALKLPRRIHTLASSIEHLLPWRGIKTIFLSSFLGIYRCTPMLSRRRNFGDLECRDA